MEPENALQCFEKVPVYVSKLVSRFNELTEIKKNQPHSSDIESEIAFIEQKCSDLTENFEVIVDFLDFSMDLLEPHFKEIDDLFE